MIDVLLTPPPEGEDQLNPSHLRPARLSGTCVERRQRPRVEHWAAAQA